MPSEELIFHRTNQQSCVWFVGPNIALSELADTVQYNVEVIQSLADTFFNDTTKEELLGGLAPVQNALAPFNSKGNKMVELKEVT